MGNRNPIPLSSDSDDSSDMFLRKLDEEAAKQKGKKKKDEVAYDKKHNRVMHKFLCNKEGFRDKKHFIRNNRKKDHRPLTCTNCEARLHARLDKDTDGTSRADFQCFGDVLAFDAAYGSKDANNFKFVRDGLLKLTERLQKRLDLGGDPVRHPSGMTDDVKNTNVGQKVHPERRNRKKKLNNVPIVRRLDTVQQHVFC
ncbi:hypothetical protein JHK85_022719 [Glycine max]|nr:hypothetical protein JHK85_022719 [Glycine max]